MSNSLPPHGPTTLCYAKSLQSCPTLSDPMDCGPPGSSIHGIFQARVLEWGAIAFSVDWLYSPCNSPGQNTGMGNLSLLQEIFPTQGSNPVSRTAGGFFTSCWATRKPKVAKGNSIEHRRVKWPRWVKSQVHELPYLIFISKEKSFFHFTDKAEEPAQCKNWLGSELKTQFKCGWL